MRIFLKDRVSFIFLSREALNEELVISPSIDSVYNFCKVSDGPTLTKYPILW